MNDAVLTYHTNPFGCGVAKFNIQLAERLGIPCEPLTLATRVCPLVSVKPSEIPDDGTYDDPGGVYDLFLHDFSPSARNVHWVKGARRIYAANTTIWADLQKFRPDISIAWCPSTVRGMPMHGELTVLLFGMGHKLHLPTLTRVQALLSRLTMDYTVAVSTAVHEGHPWDESFARTHRELSKLFGPRLRVLGYLADDGLSGYLKQPGVLAVLPFDPAARANNTTLWAAMEAGAAVLTTVDQDSPVELKHDETVLNIAQTKVLEPDTFYALGRRGQEAAKSRSWGRLLSLMLA